MKALALEEAKARLTILDLWARYGLPGTPSKSCRCPWREDHKPSFSVSADGSLWNDFATGKGGDAINFLAELCQLDRKTACRTFLEMAGGMSFIPARFTVSKPSAPVARAKPVLPEMEIGTRSELETIAKLRGIGREGLEWASERGVLRFTTSQRCGTRAWVVMDASRVNAQARRLDGQCWEHLGGAKAWTLPGSWASWPIGIVEAKDFPAVALCEGGADFLASHYVTLFEQASHYSKRDTRCAPVAMLGASQRIPAEALPLFTGKLCPDLLSRG